MNKIIYQANEIPVSIKEREVSCQNDVIRSTYPLYPLAGDQI